MRQFLLALITLMTLNHTAPAAKRTMTLDDLFKLQRVADPEISPDGKWVVYSVTKITDSSENKSVSNLWIGAADGQSPARQLTTTEKKDRHPRWSPDGKRILFESNRSGSFQLWVIDLAGGEARQLTTISTEASNGIWSHDGSQVAFVSAVYPEFSSKPFAESDKLNKEKMEQIAKGPVKARVFNRLFYRHWDSWVEDKRQHLFVLNVNNGKDAQPRDVTPGDRDAYPTSTTFSVGDDFCFSPDGSHLIFTAVPKEGEAWNTNHDLCRVTITNTSTEWPSMTSDNKGADGAPAFSPNGKVLAYRAQKQPGYEADRWQLYVVNCNPDGSFAGQPRSVTADVDRSVEEFCWTGNDSIMFVADDGGKKPLHGLAINSAGSHVRILNDGAYGSPSSSQDGLNIAFTNARMTRPAEVFASKILPNAEPTNISNVNKALLDELNLPAPTSVMVPVEGGSMQMWILKPPGFDPSKKWPVAYLVHGGPQGAWEDGWSFRWCPELWAAQGYVVALPNPRGSTGFGQKFVDEITGDWGGKCYDDLMKGVDFLEKLDYVDKDRIGAAGASFGGYMMDWFATQTPRFKCLITHCSVYNFDSMYATTDEVWFDEWEHGGPPWGNNRESYEKHSPHRHAGNLGKHKTPMLIIHNDLDFRCPVGQGIELFTALQRQGVPSKFINFPDEGHWVLKPANSQFWHKEVFSWLTKYVPPGGK